jgi:hypothetical protein
MTDQSVLAPAQQSDALLASLSGGLDGATQILVDAGLPFLSHGTVNGQGLRDRAEARRVREPA